jgi:hypothetical protein
MIITFFFQLLFHKIVALNETYVIKEPFRLELVPYVELGVKSVRPGPRHDPPPGYRVACPADVPYCIDYISSDNGTCMYPDPVVLKECYDKSCIQNQWGRIVRKQQGEDSYCKDFMTPQGRACQWIDHLPCTCESQSVYYYSGEFIPPHESIPSGFAEVHPCTYPLDLIRRAREEEARKARERKGRNNRARPRRRGRNEADSDEEFESEERPQMSREERRQKRQEAVQNGAIEITWLFAFSILVLSL